VKVLKASHNSDEPILIAEISLGWPRVCGKKELVLGQWHHSLFPCAEFSLAD